MTNDLSTIHIVEYINAVTIDFEHYCQTLDILKNLIFENKNNVITISKCFNVFFGQIVITEIITLYTQWMTLCNEDP